MKPTFKFSFILLLPLALSLICCGKAAATSYGIFVGLNSDHMEKLQGYQTVIIDASGYTTEQITQLHDQGITVYSYANFGSIETYRPYYDMFSHLTLADYDNWPDEKWLDITDAGWQDYYVKTLCGDLIAKGIDGIFMDNVDVYSLYPSNSSFNSILSVISSLKKTYSCKIMINGGYDFFNQALTEKKSLGSLIDGVNQESVFSTIDFQTGALIANSAADRDDALVYLKQLQHSGLSIYLTEYTTSPSLISQIQKYCTKNHFQYYITNSVSLN